MFEGVRGGARAAGALARDEALHFPIPPCVMLSSERVAGVDTRSRTFDLQPKEYAMANVALAVAKKAKQDEFDTQWAGIARDLFDDRTKRAACKLQTGEAGLMRV